MIYQQFMFTTRGRTYLLVHGRSLDAGVFLPRAEERAYEAVERGEASSVIRDLLSEPSWRLHELAALVGVPLDSASRRQEPEKLIARVRSEVLRPASSLGLFVRAERLRSIPPPAPSVSLADMGPLVSEVPAPRNGRLVVVVRRRDTPERVPGVLVRLSAAEGGLQAEKPSVADADDVDFGARAPGKYILEVVLRGEQEETFRQPSAMAFALAEGERKLVTFVLEPDTSFEVIFHDRERNRTAGAPFRVLTQDGAELFAGEADGKGMARFELPSASTEALTLEWAETSEDAETYVRKIFTDTKTVRDELDEVRLINLGYSCASGVAPSLQAFAKAHRLRSEEGVAKLDEVFRTEELG